MYTRTDRIALFIRYIETKIQTNKTLMICTLYIVCNHYCCKHNVLFGLWLICSRPLFPVESTLPMDVCDWLVSVIKKKNVTLFICNSSIAIMH